jgi:ubiquinone/menaquinone biosynthesis C-methylase UbiE
LPFASGSFDFVSCQYAFHQFRDKAGMLRETFRVLRRGGRFALYNICPQESKDWLYYAYFPEAKNPRFRRFLAARRDRFGNERNRFCRDRGAAAACPP